MFYRQVILRRSLPFAVEIPNAETEAAIDQAIEGKDLAEWADLDALKRARLMRRLGTTGQFERDIRRAKRRGKDLDKL